MGQVPLSAPKLSQFKYFFRKMSDLTRKNEGICGKASEVERPLRDPDLEVWTNQETFARKKICLDVNEAELEARKGCEKVVAGRTGGNHGDDTSGASLGVI